MRRAGAQRAQQRVCHPPSRRSSPHPTTPHALASTRPALQIYALDPVTCSVLRCDVNGRVVMKAFLSGMPDVKLGLNEKIEVRRGS